MELTPFSFARLKEKKESFVESDLTLDMSYPSVLSWVYVPSFEVALSLLVVMV